MAATPFSSKTGALSASELPRVATASLCALIVEDDPLTQSRLELLLESVGIAAVSVPSAKQAIEAMSAVFFPIVIVDRMLEDGDGLRLCREARRLSQGPIYLLLLSALDTPEDIATGLAAGADEYLSKRGHDGDLLSKLQAAARRVSMPVSR